MPEPSSESHIRDELRRLGHEVIAYSWWKTWEEKLLEEKPQVAFTLVVKRVTAYHVERIREITGKPVFYWNFDMMGFYDWDQEGAVNKGLQGHIDAAAAADGYFGKSIGRKCEYEQRGVKFHFLPADVAALYYDKTTKPGPAKLKLADSYDVVFTGACRGPASKSRFTLGEIAQKIAPTELHIFGQNPNRWKKLGIGVAYDGIWATQYKHLIKRAKISLAVDKRHDVEGYWSNRIARIQACGGFVLSGFTVGMERAFGPDGETLVYWDTSDDCVDKIRYYLAHDDERREIAERGYEHARRYLSHEYRLRQFLTMLRYEYGIR